MVNQHKDSKVYYAPGTARVRERLGSFADAAANLKRKHAETALASQGGDGQGGSVGSGAGQVSGADRHDQPKVRIPRKQCFGASKVVAGTGRADWTAPVEVFISNTSPDITEEDIKEILKLCADDAKGSDDEEGLANFL